MTGALKQKSSVFLYQCTNESSPLTNPEPVSSVDMHGHVCVINIYKHEDNWKYDEQNRTAERKTELVITVFITHQ